jgi:hypothetical protein
MYRVKRYSPDELALQLEDMPIYESNLYTARSNIEGAGLGVFTYIDIPENQLIALYRGKRFTENKILSYEKSKYIYTQRAKISKSLLMKIQSRDILMTLLICVPVINMVDQFVMRTWTTT